MEERKLSFYLDTTIPNYLFADDAPRERDITKQFWGEIEKDKYNVFISRLVVDEIERTPDLDRRKRLLAIISGIKSLPISAETRKLAKIYLARNIIPAKYEPDAIVTWNMDHMANPKTRIAVREKNERLRYKVIDIATPKEVMASE